MRNATLSQHAEELAPPTNAMVSSHDPAVLTLQRAFPRINSVFVLPGWHNMNVRRSHGPTNDVM